MALRYFTNVIKKRSIAFVISDFLTNGFHDALKIASRKHDVVALKVSDPREHELPDIGLVRLIDTETGSAKWVNTSNKHVRAEFSFMARKRDAEQKDIFNRCGVDAARISTDGSYVKPLQELFKRRESR
jgi:uncharacterized protein (DUF58 family)